MRFIVQRRRSVTISDDRNRYRFELREEARFHDGSSLTAEDVAFSFLLLKDKGHPQLSQNLRHLADVTVTGPHEVELVFDGKQSDRAILSVANTVPILSKAYYEANEFDAATLTAPLSSGPMRVDRFKAGDFIEYARVEDYWAKDLPFARGFYHFDRWRIRFFRERTAAFESFKKG